MIVEVDGGSHRRRARADARLRLEEALVIADLEAAVARVRAALAERG